MSLWLLENATVAAALAALIALLCPLLRHRPAVCHALWLLVLLKLLMPPLPFWSALGISIGAGERSIGRSPLPSSPVEPSAPAIGEVDSFNLPSVTAEDSRAPLADTSFREPPSIAAAIQPCVDVSKELRERIPAQWDGTEADPLAPAEAPSSDFPREAALVIPSGFVFTALAALWGIGALITLVLQCRVIGHIRCVIKQSQAALPPFEAEVATLARQFGIQTPRVLVCEHIASPMVVGLPRAALLWPAQLGWRLDSCARAAVISHELAHLKRRDHLTGWLEVGAACLWWWHPVVWIARRRLRHYAELACDAYVVAHLPEARNSYAKALVDVCEFISQVRIVAPPAVGMAHTSRRWFERRLTMVLRQRVSARMPLAAWIGLAAIGLLVLPGFSTAQVEPKKEGEATEVRTTISDKPAIAAQPTVVPTNSDRPTVEVQAVTAKPAIATEPAVDPEQRAPQLSPRPIVEAGVRPPAPAETVKASDEHLLQKVAPNRRAVRLARSRGTKLTSKEVEYISDVLMPLIERMRSQGTLRSSGWTDKYIVNEVFLHMLERMPTEPENKAWVDHVKRHGDGGIKDLVAALGQSSEFTGPEKPTAARTAAELNPLPPSKQAKVQTLLRVVYDMPADKAKALAAFLKENVHQQQLEVHVDEQAGLVVTAEGEFQAPIAAMVSLMTGERVTLDLSAGRATGYATYPSLPHSTPPKQPPHYATIPTPSTSYGPPMTAAGPRTGIFPPDDGKAAKTLDQPSDADARKPEQAPDSTTKEGSGSPLGSIRP